MREPTGNHILWSATLLIALSAGCATHDPSISKFDTSSSITWAQTATSLTTSASFTSPQTAGRLNIVVMGWGDNTSTVTSVTDSLGNAYSIAAPLVTENGVAPPLRQAIYYANNIAAGANTVTVNFSGSPAWPDLKILEYHGADSSAPLDTSAAGTGTSSGGTASSNAVTTTSANELLLGAGMTTDWFAGPGGSFTQRVISNNGNIVEDEQATGAGSYTASLALSSTDQSWIVQVVALRAATGGGGGSAPAPTVSGISPSSGATSGGTVITVSGANFVSGATVTVCGSAASSVAVASSTSVTATTPAHAAGACDVQVHNPDAQVGTLAAGFTYSSGGNSGSGSISFVQSTTGLTSASFSSQTAGDLNIVVMGWGDATASITSVTDSRGNAYAVAAPMVTENGVAPPLRQAIYYAKNIAGGANTVTVAFSGTPNYPDLKVLEYRGADTTSPLDVSASGTGTTAGGTASSSPATTTSASEMLVAAGMTTDFFAGAGGSFTLRVLSGDGNVVEDRAVTATGSYSASIAMSGNQQSWIVQMVTLRAGSGGTCVPNTCGSQCGTISDGCGGMLSCGACAGGSYSTSFPDTEDPISQGGHWMGGQDAGDNLWGDIQTTPGLAYAVSEPTVYGDPTAVLTGTWSSSQMAQATVHIVSNQVTTGGCCHEAEVRLRNTINPNNHTITGYEAYCSVMSDNPYCHIASWGGGNGVWTNMENNPPLIYLRDGDVIMGTVSGTNPVVITLYVNGAQVLQVQDTGNYTFTDNNKHGPWTSGNPGFGLFDSADENFSAFGFSSYSASNQ